MKKTAANRVLIAKDVLRQLAGRIKPSEGVYFRFDLELDSIKDSDLDKELCNLYANEPCEVCALGALFVGALDTLDDLKANQLANARRGPYAEEILRYLGRYFDQEQLYMIEIVFERWDKSYGLDDDERDFIVRGYPMSKENVMAASRYGRSGEMRFLNAEQRMREIMQNIIDNDGTFVIPDEFR